MPHSSSPVTLQSAVEARSPAARELDDTTLFERSLQNPAFFDHIVERYQDGFIRSAMRIMGSREEAEDVAQDAFVKIYFHGRSFKRQKGSSFKSWAYKILLNTAYNHYRSRQRRPVPVEEFFDTLLFDQALYEQRDSAVALDRREAVSRALNELPAELADLLRMHYIEGYSYREISYETGLTIGALKMRLYRARQLFKDYFLNVADLHGFK